LDLKQERTLIIAAQNGDETALSTLYDAYVDRIYRYIYYRVESRQNAEDITAEVFLRLVEGLPSFQDREISILAWLYRIAHARLIDHYRRVNRSGEPQDIETLSLASEDDMDSLLMTNYRQEQVRLALKSLTDEQQQVIVLRFIEGLNLQETADLLGKTLGSVKVMQHRALAALSRALARLGIVSE